MTRYSNNQLGTSTVDFDRMAPYEQRRLRGMWCKTTVCPHDCIIASVLEIERESLVRLYDPIMSATYYVAPKSITEIIWDARRAWTADGVPLYDSEDLEDVE